MSLFHKMNNGKNITKHENVFNIIWINSKKKTKKKKSKNKKLLKNSVPNLHCNSISSSQTLQQRVNKTNPLVSNNWHAQ